MTDSLDISFEVPFVHRLRFTRDVVGADRNILVNLLEASGDERVRVQVWADQHKHFWPLGRSDRLKRSTAAYQ